MLESEGLGGVLLSTQPNFSWLSAGGNSGIDTSREIGSGSLLVRHDGKRFLLANGIEMPRLLAEEVSEHDFEPIEFSWEEEKTPDFLTGRAGSLLTNKKSLGWDLSSCGSSKTVESAIAECRYQLTSDEIQRYRSLGRDAGAAIGLLAKEIEPGLTELEVARRANDALAAYNCRAIVTLVAADDRVRRFRHPLATSLRWHQTVMIVVCARREGLIASLTRLVSAGPVSEELRERTIASAHVNANLFAATRPGRSGADLYDIAARTYSAVGFHGEERMHHQGGACGYRTRDWVAHPASAQIVLDRQAFAWNPSITGTKVEETCLVYGDRIETITSSPEWPQIAVAVDGVTYESPDVLSL
jgi:Xaa-Pro aminopeptidase